MHNHDFAVFSPSRAVPVLIPRAHSLVCESPQLDGRFGPYWVSTHMSPTSPYAHPVLLKPSEVAAQLAVSRSWLYDAAKTGRIPSIRIGGEEGPLRFVPEDIQRWIDDARAAWSPGRPTVATRHAAGRWRQEGSRRAQAPASGQQSLL
jgi:excisionase family DNA binding protein